MKVFLDTADVEAVRRAHATGLLDGVTTNPSKVAETGRKLTDVVAEICSIIPGPVSAEGRAETSEDMIEEGQRIAAIAPNVVVKIPMTIEGLKAIPVLEKQKNVRVNCTMIFSATQAFQVMKTGATYISIVLSRLDAVANESEILVQDTMTIKRNYGFPSEILAASLKTQNHMLHCLRAGVDVVTISESLFLQTFEHPLTDVALAQFAKDWEGIPT